MAFVAIAFSCLQIAAFVIIDLYIQVLVGNKCDMDESKRVVPYSKGQALADEFGIQFFETSAKSNLKVEEVQSLCKNRM